MSERAVVPERFFVRARNGPTGWQAFMPVPADVPVDISALILESPEFVNAVSGGAVFLAAMPAGRERPDRVLVAIEDTGRLVIVACPAQDSMEAYQRMTADILWAGAMLWRRPYPDFASDFMHHSGTSLEQFVSDRAGPAWSSEQFRDRVRTSLSQGKFPVVIVAGGPKPVPADVIAYLKSMNLAVTVLSYSSYQSARVEVIVPGRSEGRAAQTTPATGEPAQTVPRPAPEAVRRPPSVAQIAPKPAQKGPAAATPAQSKPQPAPAAESEEQPSSDFPWARAGTKPGVMSDKRPPAPENGKRKSDTRPGGRK